jgi:acetyl-CoA carboxylase biotin carboxyl carrier protein
MDLTEIKKLAQLMLRAELTELELDDQKRGVRVHLKRGTPPGAVTGMPGMVHMLPSVVPGVVQNPAAAPGGAAEGAGAGGPPPGTEVFKSPIVGTFYRAPSPDAEPFAAPGKAFVAGSVLCIIEAMKVMNEIRAEFAGDVVEVLAENGEPVEFGQPLFLIKKA